MDKGLLKKATADSADPTPFHMLRDITQMTFSDLKVNQKVLEFLLDRLQSSKSPQQMVKTLKVIKHVCATGNPEFQKMMQKRCEDLRSFANYRGKLDPVHGNKLNEQVCQTAREAIEACFQEQVTAKITPTGEGGGFVDKKAIEESKFKTGEPVKVVPGKKFNEEWNKHQTKEGGYLKQLKKAAGGMLGGDDYHSQLVKQIESAHQSGGYEQVKLENTAHPGGGASQPTQFKFLMEGSDPTPMVSDSDVALSAHERVVDTYVAKASLGRSDLSKCIRELENVCETDDDWDEVAARFDAKLDQKVSWQQRMSSLQCIEALVRAEKERIIEYFTENPEDIVRNVTVVQTSLKEKAKKLLTALGLPHTLQQPAANRQAAPVSSASTLSSGVDLMSGLTVHSQPTTTTTAQPAESKGDLKKKGDKTKITRRRKKGDTEPEVPAASPPPAASDSFDMFQGLQPHTPAPPQLPSAPSQASPANGTPFTPAPLTDVKPTHSDCFDFLDMMNATPPAQQQKQQQPSQQHTPQFGGFPTSSPSATPPRPAASDDPFDFLVSSNPAPTPAQTPVAPHAAARNEGLNMQMMQKVLKPQSPVDGSSSPVFATNYQSQSPITMPATPACSPVMASPSNERREAQQRQQLMGLIQPTGSDSPSVPPAPVSSPMAPMDPASTLALLQQQQASIAQQIAALQGLGHPTSPAAPPACNGNSFL